MNSGTRITECEKSYYLDSYLTVHAKALHIRLFSTPWTVALQAPLSMGFSTQEYWSGLSFPPPEDLPNPGTEHRSPALRTSLAAQTVKRPPTRQETQV